MVILQLFKDVDLVFVRTTFSYVIAYDHVYQDLFHLYNYFHNMIYNDFKHVIYDKVYF